MAVRSTTSLGVLRSSRPFRDTTLGDSIRRLQDSLGEGGIVRKAVYLVLPHLPAPHLQVLPQG